MRFLTPALLALASFSVSAAALAQRGDAPDTRLRSPAESRRLFRLPPGFDIQLVAAEPEIQKPLNVAFDSAGRVWVTGSTLYPWPARRDARGEPIASFQKNWDDNQLAFRATSTPPQPAEHGSDSVRILSDFDPATGRARKITVFANGLNIPVGVLPLPRTAGAKGDTALVFSIPAIWRLTDTDGDGRADVREKLYDSFGFKDTHGMSSSYWLWFDGWVYGTHGFANVSEVVDRSGRVTKLTSGNTYRFRPDGSRFEVYVHGQTNPFGLAFDPRGDLYTADSHSKPVYLLIPGGYYEGIGVGREHDGLGYGPAITSDDHGSTAIAGLAHYSAAQFPAEFRDNLFNGNPVTRRINRARLEWRGSTPHAARQPDFLTSDDPAFRPVQAKLGPDGALWVADFYNPIIGHYEVPLTHPARDRAHGRLWRIVWRGLDGTAPVPPLPDLSRLAPAELVARISDPNLVVRSLAVSELLARPDASTAAPALVAAATNLVTGANPTADETAALPLFLTLDRLGRADDALLRRAFNRPDSAVALAAVRTLTARADARGLDRDFFAQLPKATAHLHLWRATATLFATHPEPWQTPLLLELLLAAPDYDTELNYALRLALKQHLLRANSVAELHALVDSAPKKFANTAERLLAEIALAVPTPAAAEFLLAHLERTKFSAPRAGDFARHAVLHLPLDQLSSVLPLMRSLARAPIAQRIALAEGLAQVARPESTEGTAQPERARPELVERTTQPERTLPPEAETWMRSELLTAVDDSDAALALRAINALKPLSFPEKNAALRAIALNAKIRDTNRTAALRALDLDAPETEETLRTVLSGRGSNALRRTAAELLGTASPTPAAREALTSAFSGASADLALGLAVALAKSDTGALDLLDLATTGRVKRTLLRHRHVEVALQKRSREIQDRVAALTRSLPDEDARLDALIAERFAAVNSAKADLAHGAAVFAMHCATCHRFRDHGGTLGPSLDGSEARTLARLLEDILDPSRNVDPAFRLTTVTLKNGEAKSGMNHREQSGQILLTDPATGQDTALPATDIAETTASAISPMPAAFESLLTPQELADVIAYLRSSEK